MGNIGNKNQKWEFDPDKYPWDVEAQGIVPGRSVGVYLKDLNDIKMFIAADNIRKFTLKIRRCKHRQQYQGLNLDGLHLNDRIYAKPLSAKDADSDGHIDFQGLNGKFSPDPAIDEDDDGSGENDTFLHAACRAGAIRIIIWLMHHGASTEIANNDGKKPLDCLDEKLKEQFDEWQAKQAENEKRAPDTTATVE